MNSGRLPPAAPAISSAPVGTDRTAFRAKALGFRSRLLIRSVIMRRFVRPQRPVTSSLCDDSDFLDAHLASARADDGAFSVSPHYERGHAARSPSIAAISA